MLKYVTGDATAPQGAGPNIIVHLCNDAGRWGAGFVLAVSRRWPEPERQYRRWQRAGVLEGRPFALGQTQLVQVADTLGVANLMGQHGIRRRATDGPPPMRYEALPQGLGAVRERARVLQASVHLPRLGAGLAGGSWPLIATIIEEELTAHGISVTVYNLPRRA